MEGSVVRMVGNNWSIYLGYFLGFELLGNGFLFIYWFLFVIFIFVIIVVVVGVKIVVFCFIGINFVFVISSFCWLFV